MDGWIYIGVWGVGFCCVGFSVGIFDFRGIATIFYTGNAFVSAMSLITYHIGILISNSGEITPPLGFQHHTPSSAIFPRATWIHIFHFDKYPFVLTQ